MPKLVLINGAPGSGKSTLARRYVDDHPLALALDVDVVRGLLGAWLATPTEAGWAARALALAMARTHLRAGHEVVVPQFLARSEFLAQLDALAGALAVPFVEIALLADAEDLRHRFELRSAIPVSDVHRDAETLLAFGGGPDRLGERQDQLLAMIETRPGTHRIRTVSGRIDEAYRDLEAAISSSLR